MDKYSIILLAPGMAFQGDSLGQHSLGGSETAALYMARELRARGHDVTVFANTSRPGDYGGVIYRGIGEFEAYSQAVPHDICIVQRIPEPFAHRKSSRLNLLWCHDLALLRQAAPFKGVLWNVDQVFVLSRYMAEQYRQVYGLGDDILWVTRNGVEVERFRAIEAQLRRDGIGRDRRKLLYCARPERGLDVLLGAIFPKILQRVPDATLYVAGYDNTVPHMAEFYTGVNQMMAAYGPRVVWLGHLAKDELYRHYLTARVYAYPTPSPTMPQFAEISCISAMEAQAAGVPVVSTRRGALPETLAEGAGVLVEGVPSEDAYQAAFVDAVVRYLNDDVAWGKASHAGRKRAAELDWSGVAAHWERRFEELLAARNDDPLRLVRHFIRHSDIVVAKALLDSLEEELIASTAY